VLAAHLKPTDELFVLYQTDIFHLPRPLPDINPTIPTMPSLLLNIILSHTCPGTPQGPGRNPQGLLKDPGGVLRESSGSP